MKFKNPFIILALLILLTACSKPTVVTNPAIGSIFPSVVGESLDKQTIKIPENFSGKPTVLLIGYLQKAQFDIDRWILGIIQLETPVKIVELPTIAGMMPQMVQGFINNGMRRGIPESDWKSVVTVYEDADKIVKVLGNERPQNAYVVLIDRAGIMKRVINEGYSATNVKEIDRLARELEQ